MLKKSFTGIFIILAVLTVWSLMFYGLPFIIYGVAPAEKTLFKEADPYGSVFIHFHDVIVKKNNGQEIITTVAVEPEENNKWFQVKVQPDLKCTLLSVRPEFSSRIYGGGILTRANQVTVWVSSPEEKILWERWAQKVEKDYWDYKKTEEGKLPEVKEKPTCRKIIPPV